MLRQSQVDFLLVWTDSSSDDDNVENDKENELSDLTDFTDASQNWINNRIGGANKVILERDLRVHRYFYSHAILLINIINKLNTAINKLYL